VFAARRSCNRPNRWPLKDEIKRRSEDFPEQVAITRLAVASSRDDWQIPVMRFALA